MLVPRHVTEEPHSQISSSRQRRTQQRAETRLAAVEAAQEYGSNQSKAKNAFEDWITASLNNAEEVKVNPIDLKDAE